MDYEVKALLISAEEINKYGRLDPKEIVSVLEEALIAYKNKEILLPDKISQVFDEETQNRINCMPSTIKYLGDNGVCGVKWVSVFPGNPQKYDVPNVSGVIILSELKKGYPFAIMDGTLITVIRTAYMGALAAKYLARKDSKRIGIIGAGEQARMHFVSMKSFFPNLTTCFVASRTEKSEQDFVSYLGKRYPEVEFVKCNGNFDEASKEADIIVTAVSCQEPLLKSHSIKEGAFYCHVGGYEDEYDVVKKADKIICDNWNALKHRGSPTLARMYSENLLSDRDIYADIVDIIDGSVLGRENDTEFIYFNSVGLGFIDVAMAYYCYKNVKSKNAGTFFVLSDHNPSDFIANCQ